MLEITLIYFKMDKIWSFVDALSVYVPSVLYVPVIILVLGLLACIIDNLSSDKPTYNPIKSSSGYVKNWHRSETSGRLQSRYTRAKAN